MRMLRVAIGTPSRFLDVGDVDNRRNQQADPVGDLPQRAADVACITQSLAPILALRDWVQATDRCRGVTQPVTITNGYDSHIRCTGVWGQPLRTAKTSHTRG